VPYRLPSPGADRTNTLHLGITEAGALRSGSGGKSAVGLGMLLRRRYRETESVFPWQADRFEGIKVDFDLLKSLRLPRSRWYQFYRVPELFRQNFDVDQDHDELEARLEDVVVPL